jgi:hypothetical protein
MAKTVTARSLKVTVVLDPIEVLHLGYPPGPRTALHIDVAGRVVSADLNSKTLRKVITTIQDSREVGCAVILQGKLVGERIEEAGLVAQPKVAKAQAA